jgi:hypothetical protein
VWGVSVCLCVCWWCVCKYGVVGVCVWCGMCVWVGCVCRVCEFRVCGVYVGVLLCYVCDVYGVCECGMCVYGVFCVCVCVCGVVSV